MSAFVAASPEPKHSPCFAPSSPARLRSSAARVALCVRAYSKPVLWPSAACAYVLVW